MTLTRPLPAFVWHGAGRAARAPRFVCLLSVLVAVCLGLATSAAEGDTWTPTLVYSGQAYSIGRVVMSADGRAITFNDGGELGELWINDTATGQNHDTGVRGYPSSISADGRYIAYVFAPPYALIAYRNHDTRRRGRLGAARRLASSVTTYAGQLPSTEPTTSMVIDVIVLDKTGEPIAGLNPGDFHLQTRMLEMGRSRKECGT